jgi:hypothetical protein
MFKPLLKLVRRFGVRTQRSETVAESFAALQDDGLIRWSGKFRAGQPVWITTDLENEISSSPPLEQDALTPGEEWEGDVHQLAAVVPSLLDHSDLCDQTFDSRHEAFVAGFNLGGEERP